LPISAQQLTRNDHKFKGYGQDEYKAWNPGFPCFTTTPDVLLFLTKLKELLKKFEEVLLEIIVILLAREVYF